MKKFIAILMVVVLSGCSSVKITSYIAANHPYQKKFLANYDKTFSAINEILVKDGWKVEGTAEPTVFERAAEIKPDAQSIVVFTEARKSSWLIFSTYTHLNVFIYSKGDESEVEIRYASVTSWPFKQFHHYRNDGLTARLFRYLEANLAAK